MSRINTQDDRLTRGVRPLEQQRSFLVQPRSFQAGRSGLSGLAEALGSVSRTVRAAKANVDARRKEKTDTAEYNTLLEARNRANLDPATYGDEYVEMYQTSLENREEGDPLRTQILRLDADNFVKGRVQQEENLLKARVTTEMNDMFIDIGTTYDDLSPEELLGYSNMPATERYKVLYNEYLDSFLENDPDVHEAILNFPQLEALLSSQVSRKSSEFQPAHDRALAERRSIDFQKAVEGMALIYSTTNTWDEGGIAALAKRGGIPVETARAAVLDQTLGSIQLDMQKGRITLGEAYNTFERLREATQGYGLATEQSIAQVESKLVDLAVQDAKNDSSSKMNTGLNGGVPLEDIVNNSDEYLLGILSEVTGVAYGEGDSILTADAPIGMPNAVLASLRDIHGDVQRKISEVDRLRTARSGTNAGTEFQEFTKALSYHGIRTGDFTILEGYDGATIGAKAYNAGFSEFAYMANRFPNQTAHANQILEGFLGGSTEERAYSLGALNAYPEDAVLNATRELDREDQLGLMFVRRALEGLDPSQADFSNPEFINDLQGKFDQGQKIADAIGEIGSGAASTVVSKSVRKGLNLPAKATLSDQLVLELALQSSRLENLEGDDGDKDARLVATFLTSGNTIYLDGATQQYSVLRDPQRLLPQSSGHSQKEVDWSLDTTRGTFATRQEPAFGEEEGLANTAMRVGFTNATPLLPAIIAGDLGIEITGNAEAMTEVAALLTGQALTQNAAIGEDPLALEPFKNAFTNPEGSREYLRLGIGMDNGTPYLVATGYLADQEYIGQSAILLAPWNPAWNANVGESRESVERAVAGLKFGAFVGEALHTLDEANSVNRELGVDLKIRP